MKMSFHNTQASVRYVFLTGKPGIGKSTLVKKVCAELAQKGVDIKGFYTEEIRQSNGGSRIGFDVVTINGTRAPLARVSSGAGQNEPRVGKYTVQVKSFEETVLPILYGDVSANTVLIIDEIGRMEMLSGAFSREVKSVFNKSHTILATIPISNNSFVKGLQTLPSAQTFEVNYTNRNSLLEPIMGILLQSVKKN